MRSKTRNTTSLQVRDSDCRYRWVSPVQERVEAMIRRGWTLRRKHCPGLWPDYKYWLRSLSLLNPRFKTLNWRTGAALWEAYGEFVRKQSSVIGIQKRKETRLSQGDGIFVYMLLGIELDRMPKIWIIYALATLFLWGLWGIFAKLADKQLSGWSVYMISFLPSIVIVAIGSMVPRFRPQWEFPSVIFAILAGVVGALGTILFYMALDKGQASIVVPITALYPVVTVVIALLVLGEKLSVSQGFGVILALAAAFLLSR